MNGFNPRPSSFMGTLAWAVTEARLKGFAFCPLAGERVGGCAVEWLSRSFDAMSPTHKFDVEVTDLAKGTHTTFSVIRKQRTYRATGRTTVRYNTPVGNFSTFDEVNTALVAEALAAGARAAEVVEATPNSEGSDLETGIPASEPVMGNPISAVDAAPMGNPMDVLAAPERHEQPQQRHYAGAVAEAAPTQVTAAQALRRAADWAEATLVIRGLRGDEGTDATRAVVTRVDAAQRALLACGAGHLRLLATSVEDGPHEQVEQQQAQALAVAVAGFEPECDRCGALLNERGGCPVCTPRWQPCETGVRHAQTIPISRHAAYAEHVKADAAAQAGRKEGAGPARQRRLDEASQDAWTAFKRWKDADNFAARAGAHDHLRWADL